MLKTLGRLIDRARRLAVRAATDREARVVLAFSVLLIGGGFFGNRLLTQIASPAALGQYYLFANLAQWLSMPAAAGFVYLNHHWPIAREHGDTRRFARGMGVGALLLLPIAVVGVLLFRAFNLVETNSAAVLIALLCLGNGAFQIYATIPSTERLRGWSGTLGLLGGTGRPFIQAFGILFFGAAAGLGLLGSAATLQLAAAGVAGYMFWRIFRSTLSAAPPRPAIELSLGAFFSYSIPGFFGVLASLLASSVERWGLARSSDVSATALFVQAMGLSLAAAGAIGSVFQSYYYPFATNAAARNMADPLGAAAPILIRFYSILTLSLVSFALVFALFVRQITWLAFGSRFAAVAGLLPWTIVGACLFSLGQALTVALFVARDPLWPNLSRIISQALYAAALLLLPRGSDPAGLFARLFVCGQALYVAMIGFAIWRRLVARRARLITAG